MKFSWIVASTVLTTCQQHCTIFWCACGKHQWCCPKAIVGPLGSQLARQLSRFNACATVVFLLAAFARFQIAIQRLLFAIFLDACRRKSNSIMCAHIAQFICATSCLQNTCLLHPAVACCCCNNYFSLLLWLFGAIWQFCKFIFLFAHPTNVALSSNTVCFFNDRSFVLSLLRDFLLSFSCLKLLCWCGKFWWKFLLFANNSFIWISVSQIWWKLSVDLYSMRFDCSLKYFLYFCDSRLETLE